MRRTWTRTLCASIALIGAFWISRDAAAGPTEVSALEFDGSSSYVTMGQASGLGSETFTLETWFVRRGAGQTTTSGTGGIIGIPLVAKGRGESDGNNRDCNYFFAIRSSDNVLAADFEDLASGLNHPVAGTTPIQNDVWYHAAATYDGSTWRARWSTRNAQRPRRQRLRRRVRLVHPSEQLGHGRRGR